MTETIKFVPGTLAKGGSSLGDASGRLQSDFQSLAGDAPPFGEDDISQLCKMVYDAIVQVVQESSGGVGESWKDTGQKLAAADKANTSTEELNTTEAGSVV